MHFLIHLVNQFPRIWIYFCIPLVTDSSIATLPFILSLPKPHVSVTQGQSRKFRASLLLTVLEKPRFSPVIYFSTWTEQYYHIHSASATRCICLSLGIPTSKQFCNISSVSYTDDLQLFSPILGVAFHSLGSPLMSKRF